NTLLSQSDPGSIHCLTRGQSIGLTVCLSVSSFPTLVFGVRPQKKKNGITEDAFVYFLGDGRVGLDLACRGARRIHPNSRASLHPYIHGAPTNPFGLTATPQRNGILHFRRTGKRHLIQVPMDVLMLSLFFADLLAGDRRVGSFCTAQGVVQQLGETSVAITTLLIAIFTFAGVWYRAGSTRVAALAVALAWLFVILMIVIGNAMHSGAHNLFESPTPYWCWIGQGYLGFRLAGEYIWFWLTLAVSLAAYLLLFLWARGNISLSDTDAGWFRIVAFHRASADPDASARRVQRETAYKMIAYPACYCLLVLPLSVVRWIGFQQESGGRPNRIPSAATFGVISLYGLSGALNVVLLLGTKNESPLFGRGTWDDEEDFDGVRNGLGRAPSVSESAASASSFRARSRGSRSGSLPMGRLPSASDGGWDLPRAKMQQRDAEEDESI
ncbi:hypothetical protein C8R46DRAFT_1052886, partial [Mycena filopes]